MTRKRLRYSDLAGVPSAMPTATPVADAEQQADAPAAAESTAAPESAMEIIPDAPLELEARREEMAPGETIDVWAEHDDAPVTIETSPAEPLLQSRQAAPEAEESGAPVAPPTPARPRRNSTPVELARTLSAERATARAKDGIAGDPVDDRDHTLPHDLADAPLRTLRERARARRGSAELLMFRVGGERFAVELIRVDEVVDLPVIHHVPEMPPAMVGVVTVRGALTPVYSPQHALGLTLARRDALLIFRRGAHRVGILIDDVDDALIVDMGELREKPAGEEGDNVLLGVIRLAADLVGIIDADALITSCQSAKSLEPA